MNANINVPNLVVRSTLAADRVEGYANLFARVKAELFEEIEVFGRKVVAVCLEKLVLFV